MAGRMSTARLEQRLRACQRDYDAAKARIGEVGFICEGSLAERFMPCGKPNCRCVDPDRRHGPYYQLTWKQDGRTVTRRLTAEQARLYREWVANRRQLESILSQMRAISRKASQYLLDQATQPDTPGRPQRRPTPAS